MTLKIEKHSDGEGTTIQLIGRMRAEHLDELDHQIKDSRLEVLLDLRELSLIDVEAVRYLGACEARGVKLTNCPAYIRDWIAKENG
jgi:anti-anti-sigma regulatory factor